MAAKTAHASSYSKLLIAGYSVLVLGFLAGGVAPALHGLNVARADIQKYQADIDTRLARTRELQDIKGQVALAELDTRDFARLVPPSQDLGPFLTQLYEQLGAAGMRDISVRNLAPTPLAHSQKLPIEVHGKGTYAQFHDFLVRLENLQRLSSVGKISVDADTDMSGNVEVQLTLFIYSAKPS
jgi:Tfp pilus assembly protein PilO